MIRNICSQRPVLIFYIFGFVSIIHLSDNCAIEKLGWKINIRSVGTHGDVVTDPRGAIKGKAGKTGKTAGLPKFLDMLTISQSGGGDRLRPPIGFDSPKHLRDYAPGSPPFYERLVNPDPIILCLYISLSLPKFLTFQRP